MNRLAVLVLCASLVAVNARTAYVCNVQLKGFALENPKMTVNGGSYSFVDDFNSMSFGGFYSPSGDVEGRSAVRGNVNVNSYSWGYELRTGGVTAVDTPKKYSLVAGGVLTMGGGAFYPLGDGFPYEGEEEKAFASSLVGPAYLAEDVESGASIDAAFENAQEYFDALSQAFAAVPATATVAIQYGGATITCDSSDLTIVVTMTPQELSATTYYTFVGCNAAATLLVNVIGSGDVTFSGDNQYLTIEENVLYNIPSADASKQVKILTEVRGSILAPKATYVQPGTGVVKGLVIAGDMAQVHQINRVECTPPKDEQPTTPTCLGFETQCAGLDFINGMNFRDFNAVVFGDFKADTGDVEGRVAVQGDFTVGCGYSVGAELKTSPAGADASRPYSLVVGGDATWCSGELYPTGSGIPYAGNREDAYVVGSAQFPDNLAQRYVAGSDLTSAFNAAKGCYEGFSATIASYDNNATMKIQDSAAYITCNDADSESYAVTINGAQFSQFTYYILENCNFQAYWFINVVGNTNVDISGASFPAIPGGVVYNVQGSGRTINVHDTALAGHLLAPGNILNQEGVILGKVIVASVPSSRQINRENTCPEQVEVEARVALAEDMSESDQLEVKKRSSSVSVSMVTKGDCSNVEAGSVINTADGRIVVISSSAGSTTPGSRTCNVNGEANYNVPAASAGSQIGTVTRLSTSPNTKPVENNQDSSAAFVAVSVAAIVAAALVL